MTVREQLEYSVLRATIRERGTARFCIFAVGFVAWGALTTATATLTSTPVATLLPLLVLAAMFETVYAIHIGVERVGRYIQVFYETDGDARWEHTAMAFGRPPGAASADALFSALFVLAAISNVMPALILEPTRSELVFIGGAHALFLVRLATARLSARRQREIDLARFTKLRGSIETSAQPANRVTESENRAH
jgi:hypothetical protein